MKKSNLEIFYKEKIIDILFKELKISNKMEVPKLNKIVYNNNKNLEMSLDVNEKKMQRGNTNKMIFNINYLLSYLSNFMSLQPGDIVTTGTPPGVGMGKKPPLYLKSGDEMRLSIDYLGNQNQRVR